MGLFRDKNNQAFGYRRPRADAAPEGWIAAQALVDTCEQERTNTRASEVAATSSNGCTGRWRPTW